MISALRKYKNVILVIVILALLSGIGYVGYGVVANGAADRGTAAVVGAEKIRAADLNNLVRRQETALRRQGKDLEEADMTYLRQSVLQSLLYESAMVQGARQFGLAISDFELAYLIKTSPVFAGPYGFDKKTYVWTVRNQFNMNPADFEEQQRRAMLAQRFATVLASAYRVTPEEIKYNFKTQYGNVKDFDAKKADFIPTVRETKANAAASAWLADFNAHNRIKILTE